MQRICQPDQVKAPHPAHPSKLRRRPHTAGLATGDPHAWMRSLVDRNEQGKQDVKQHARGQASFRLKPRCRRPWPSGHSAQSWPACSPGKAPAAQPASFETRRQTLPDSRYSQRRTIPCTSERTSNRCASTQSGAARNSAASNSRAAACCPDCRSSTAEFKASCGSGEHVFTAAGERQRERLPA